MLEAPVLIVLILNLKSHKEALSQSDNINGDKIVPVIFVCLMKRICAITECRVENYSKGNVVIISVAVVILKMFQKG